MKRTNLTPGTIMNEHGITYIEDYDSYITISNRIKRRCLFKCSCGKEFVSNLADVYKKRTSCGCKKGNKPKEYISGEYINGIKLIRSCGTTKYAQRAIFECPKCKKEWESLVSNIQAGNTKSCCTKKRGWSRSQWVGLSDTASLYKVRLYNDCESFIKIGITTKKINLRFAEVPYNYDVLKLIKGESGYIFDLENRCKRLFKKYKYKPLIRFRGETECYNL